MKKIACALASFTSILLLVTSCAQSAKTTTAYPSAATTTATQTTQPASASAPESPKYGGWVTVGDPQNIGDFDEVYGFGATAALTLHLTNQELWMGDWTKGPAGTNVTDWQADTWDSKTGSIAESWDFSQLPQGIMVFKIRKGIHYALNPNSEASRLVNGRELTADDVVFSIKQVCTNPRAYIYLNVPAMRTANVTAPDKYTVVVQIPPENAEEIVGRVTDFIRIVPPEVVQKYGDMRDWRNSVGSGPFMLTDFVDNSSATLGKNSNFWGTDPIGPGKGNHLPYVDGVRILILPDQSTQQAAIRTGKVDRMSLLDWEVGPILIKRVPALKYLKVGPNGSGGSAINWRTDKPPFNDIRVRRALMMAINWNEMNTALFGGGAIILTWPIGYYPELKDAYLGPDDPEMPASVKELYAYNTDKAKALLSQAGYPNGFTTRATFQNTQALTDFFSVLANMWSKVGVTLNLDSREYGVFSAIMRSRGYEQIEGGTVAPVSNLYRCLCYWGNAQTNGSYVNDPHVDEVRAQMQKVVLADRAAANKLHKDLMKYVLDQAWAIPYPGTATYTIWWPWLKNYRGEASLGYFNDPIFTQYAWVDQDLQKSLGH